MTDPTTVIANPAREPTLIEVAGLTVAGGAALANARVLDDVSFSIGRAEAVALVGESGSGKSTVALAMLDLLPSPALSVTAGTIALNGEPIVRSGMRMPRGIRGRRIGIVFQDPLDALNPTMRIGDQVAEALLEEGGVRRKQAREMAIDMLAEVGIPQPRDKARMYPHEISGGQRQRVMIAIALALRPDLLIADEPTTALDVTIQRQIIDLLLELREQRQMALLFISHDLPLVAEVASRVIVLYGGRVMESGAVEDVYEHPSNPYTRGLLASSPSYDEAGTTAGVPIGGVPPWIGEQVPGCRFNTRCARAQSVCQVERPVLRRVEDGGAAHECACHFPELPMEVASGGA